MRATQSRHGSADMKFESETQVEARDECLRHRFSRFQRLRNMGSKASEVDVALRFVCLPLP